MTDTTIFRLKSHPSPEGTLFRHLKIVGKRTRENIIFYNNINCHYDKKDILQLAFIIGITHDFAKATTFFQNMLLYGGKRSIYSSHSMLSALFTYYISTKFFPDKKPLSAIGYIVVRRHHGDLRNLLQIESDVENFNFDVLTNQLNDIKKVQIDGYKAKEELETIYKNLIADCDIKEFFNYDLKSLIKDIRRSIKTIVNEKEFNNYFILLSLYSSLQDADKSDAGKIIHPPRLTDISFAMIENYRQTKFFSTSKSTNSNHISLARNKAYNHAMADLTSTDITNERIFSICLPTGFGKTIIGLACAFWIRSKIENKLGYSPRIIYSLPFLSVIDQNAQVIKDILSLSQSLSKNSSLSAIPSNLFLIHHHLADFTYTYKQTNYQNSEIRKEDDYESIDHRSSIFLIEGWNSEIIITSFIQFFESIITNRKGMIRKFNNITNSIIILDEIQSIPPKYWNVIENTLEYLCKNFGCWIIIMTATKPSLLNSSKELGLKDINIKDRVKYKITNTKYLSELLDLIIDIIGKEKSLLVVLNTIGSSKEIYQLLKERLLETLFENYYVEDEDGICIYGEQIQLIYLSSTVLPNTRLKRIQRIRQVNNQKEKTESGTPKKTIVISTQIVEAGVDIDMDCVIRDFAPVDSIIQCAGRCNRNGTNDISEVIIVKLEDEKYNNRLFSSYVYDNVLLSTTKDILSKFDINESIRESQIFDQIENYFRKVRDSKSSIPLLDLMKILSFDDVSTFKLIENYETLQVLVEVDDDVKSVRQKIENNELADKIRFLPQIKKILNSYTLNVKKPDEIEVASLLPSIGETNIKYIPYEEISTFYDKETGLDLKLEKSIERRII